MDSPHFTVAFYNLENLFDTTDDPHILDDDFTPSGFKKWKKKRLHRKLEKLAQAIARIGEEEGCAPPTLLGIAEVENKKVIRKLLAADGLQGLDYDFIHFNSPDERGIDTALLYKRNHFTPIAFETVPLILVNKAGERDYTRDILYVHGKLNGEEVHLFINHWPSRRQGEDESEPKRIKAAETVLAKIHALHTDPSLLNIIVMGDFNDGPYSKSIETLLSSGLFINPMKTLAAPNSGSANYKGKWSLFDQILISHSFLNYGPGTHSFSKAAIFSPSFLKQWKGRYKGNPFRTFAGRKYLGGYSDHFPVYILLKLNT